MDDDQRIKEFHRSNVIIWVAIITGIIILTVVTYIIDGMRMFDPLNNAAQINQIIFFIAVVAAFAILFLKRTFFLPEKIINKLDGSSPDERINQVFNQIKKNYIIVWGLGEFICLIGFVNYILTTDFNYFLVFAVVSLYSILINMPRIALPINCIDRIRQTN